MGSVGGEEAIHEPTGHDERILVSVRLRPLNEKELARNDLSDWECINDTTIIYRSNLSASDRSLYPTAYSFGKNTLPSYLIWFNILSIMQPRIVCVFCPHSFCCMLQIWSYLHMKLVNWFC